MLDNQHAKILRQISIFLENRPGCLAQLTSVLAERGVNLRALTIADTERFGVVRIIVAENETALAALHDAGFTAKVSDVVGVEVPDRPGSLAHILTLFDGDVSVEYMYASFHAGARRPIMIMKLTPAALAVEILEQADLYEA